MVTTLSWALVSYLAAQRLWELRLAAVNERTMRAQGGREHGRGHYFPMVLFHAVFFLDLSARLAGGARISFASGPWLALFAAAQGLRFWAVSALGPCWSTRVWTVPGRKPVRAGPYRFFRHPIYAAVVAEIFSVPLALGLPRDALALTLGNAALLAVRIPAEERALALEVPGRLGP